MRVIWRFSEKNLFLLWDVRNLLQLHMQLQQQLLCWQKVIKKQMMMEIKKYDGHLNLYCSGNIIKNVKSVTVPNSGGMRGIEAAAVLGMVGGQAERKLEVLEGITEAERIQTAKLLEAQFCTCYLEEGVENLYIRAELTQNGHRAVVVIENKHTNIVLIKKDDEILLEKKGFQQKKTEKNQDKRDLLNVADILEFAEIVDIKEIEEVIGRQIV